MDPVLQSCQFIIRIVRDLIAGVRYSGLTGGSQASSFVASKAAAQRLVAGLRLAEAYLRRVLLIMALELEPTLVDVPQPLGRPRNCVTKPKAVATRAVFKVFQNVCAIPDGVLTKMRQGDFSGTLALHDHAQPKPVFIGRLQARLDNLAKISGDPLPRARRLAFHLARKRPGPMFEPDRHVRPSNSLGRLRRLWNTETSATFDAMGMDIRTKSRARPPPLPPRRRYGPSILVLGG